MFVAETLPLLQKRTANFESPLINPSLKQEKLQNYRQQALLRTSLKIQEDRQDFRERGRKKRIW